MSLRWIDDVRLEPFRWLAAALVAALVWWFAAIAVLFGIATGIGVQDCATEVSCIERDTVASVATLLTGAALFVAGLVLARIVLQRPAWHARVLLGSVPAILAAVYVVVTRAG